MILATYSDRQSLLPPRGLLLSLLGQVPLIIGNWPLKPSMFEVLAGLVVIAAGIALNIWAARLFERDSIGICPFSSTPVLVTRGPFVVTRHPMYLGLVAIALGLSLATGVLANMWSAVTLPFGFITHTSCPKRSSCGTTSIRLTTSIQNAFRDGCAWANDQNFIRAECSLTVPLPARAGTSLPSSDSKDEVVASTRSLSGKSDFAGMNQEWVKWFPVDPPARQAAKLPVRIPGMRVSIAAIAEA